MSIAEVRENDTVGERDLKDALSRAGIARAFVAAPMSAFESEEEYHASRAAILDLRNDLIRRLRLKDVYYAGTPVGSADSFTAPDEALRSDMSALIESDLFILVFPRRVFSSALVETGYAMALKKPIVIVVTDPADLPYLLTQAASLSGQAPLPPMSLVVMDRAGRVAEAVHRGLRDLCLNDGATPDT